MEEEPFIRIIKNYTDSVDGTQKLYEDQKLEVYSAFEEVMENPRKIDLINKSIHECLTYITSLFESSTQNSISHSVSGSELGHSQVLQDELNKINECFYGTLGRPHDRKR